MSFSDQSTSTPYELALGWLARYLGISQLVCLMNANNLMNDEESIRGIYGGLSMSKKVLQ